MIHRIAEHLVRQRLEDYPAVAILGPRQSGKTTLAKAIGGKYFDLEDPSDRVGLDLQWATLTPGADLVILDEAQALPEVFPRLRSAIDKDRHHNGRFLLLGSVSPALMRQVSESLAGRLALVELTPLVLEELSPDRMDDLWLYGGYPLGGILEFRRYPVWQGDYLSLLAQRDLPAWGLPAAPQVTARLIQMLAAVDGQVWNASQIGQSLALSYQTVNSYVDYLVGSFLIRRLDPFHGNARKRLAKRPKVYWRDSGLMHAVMQVRDMGHLLGLPWVGASWECFVIEQILAHLGAWGVAYRASYLRTSDGYEIDLVLEVGGRTWAVETKLTASPSIGDIARARKAAALIGADLCAVVSRTSEPVEGEGTLSTNLPAFLKTLAGRVG
ncbi:MAG: ATP-binding protein [Planctomycetota bacterium]|nr:ATP-binding protein [Planctomycetota bacterium]